MSNTRREVTYDVTALKPYAVVPRALRNQMTDQEYLARVFRYYFQRRVNDPTDRPDVDRNRKRLATHSALSILRRTALKEDQAYRSVVVALMNVFQEIERFVVWPRHELPSLIQYEAKKDLDEGIPRDMFRHYSGRLSNVNILGQERWLLHFNLNRDYYANN